MGLLPQFEIACIDPHQTGSVHEGSDRLQLIKFWPSCIPGKGVCGGVKIFRLRLTTARAQCLCFLQVLFFIGLCGPVGDSSRAGFDPWAGVSAI